MVPLASLCAGGRKILRTAQPKGLAAYTPLASRSPNARPAHSPDLRFPPQARLSSAITIKKASTSGGFFNGARCCAVIGLGIMMILKS